MIFRPKNTKPDALAEAIAAKLGNPDWLLSVRVTKEKRAGLVVDATGLDAAGAESRRMEAEAAARAVPGIGEVHVALSADQALLKADAPPRRVRKGARLSDEAVRQSAAPERAGLAPVPGIARIVAVASAKGGVGKSTVAVNLAAALAKAGLTVGLLDSDIYGPSVPTMLGTVDREPEALGGKRIAPVEAHGVKSLSIGYLSDPDAPMIWRGPVVMSAITQMLTEGAWGSPEDPLDILIIDTPPGTGDAALTLAQRVPLDAAILVTTPQEVALADVRRGAAMFAKTAVPVLGVVETMSWFDDPAGGRHYLFGDGGGKAMAATLGLPLLGQLPVLTGIREAGDRGTPAALGNGPAADLFANLARTVALQLDALQTKPAPVIRFED